MPAVGYRGSVGSRKRRGMLWAYKINIGFFNIYFFSSNVLKLSQSRALIYASYKMAQQLPF